MDTGRACPPVVSYQSLLVARCPFFVGLLPDAIGGSPRTEETLDLEGRGSYSGCVATSVGAPLAHQPAMDTKQNKRITIEEIADRLSIGRLAVYALLERKEIPAIRLGRRWIVTRYAYENWERTCGTTPRTSTNVAPAVQSSYGGL
jgi:excisionase family DNA binding protein